MLGHAPVLQFGDWNQYPRGTRFYCLSLVVFLSCFKLKAPTFPDCGNSETRLINEYIRILKTFEKKKQRMCVWWSVCVCVQISYFSSQDCFNKPNYSSMISTWHLYNSRKKKVNIVWILTSHEKTCKTIMLLESFDGKKTYPIGSVLDGYI